MRTIKEELLDKLGEAGYKALRRKLRAITRAVEAQKKEDKNAQ